MGKKNNKIISQPTAQSKSLFESVGSVIASYIAVASIVGGACYFIGYHMRLREYESQIEDLKFEKMQLQLEHQRDLEEVRTRPRFWVLVEKAGKYYPCSIFDNQLVSILSISRSFRSFSKM